MRDDAPCDTSRSHDEIASVKSPSAIIFNTHLKTMEVAIAAPAKWEGGDSRVLALLHLRPDQKRDPMIYFDIDFAKQQILTSLRYAIDPLGALYFEEAVR